MEKGLHKAISVAVERGGWKPCELIQDWKNVQLSFKDSQNGVWISNPIGDGCLIEYYRNTICASDFWQALGRALGWKQDSLEAEWLKLALEYFELRFTVGDTERFWQELLT